VLALSVIEDTTASSWAREYHTRLKSVRPILRGDDLQSLGVPRGPAVGEVLARLRAAMLDGETNTRADEERLVRDYLAQNTK
jgi:tRNA nucleotidyltransferase (CCA-adding enzyme)